MRSPASIGPEGSLQSLPKGSMLDHCRLSGACVTIIESCSCSHPMKGGGSFMSTGNLSDGIICVSCVPAFTVTIMKTNKRSNTNTIDVFLSIQ